MKIVLGSDHGGFELKEALKDFFTKREIAIEDLGNEGLASVDYPDYAARVAESISNGSADAGVLICGTGLGMCIAANKFKGVRAVVLSDKYSAEMAKAHNNANVVCLGGRVKSVKEAEELLAVWLDTDYEGGRHDRRLKKIADLEV